jgi:hypothetical protein
VERAPKVRENSGQSTVEFILTFILFFAFFMFYFQLSMALAFGNYVHYASFMSARAYLASGPDLKDQQARAREVIVRMLKKSVGQSGVDRFPSIAKGFGPGDPPGFQVDPPSEYVDGNPASSWLQGVRYTFNSKLFMIPLAGLGKAGATSAAQATLNSVTLTSESWLGREPADNECRSDMGNKNWFFDNGC